MEDSAVRVERTPTRRRALWPPLRRRHDVAITLPLPSIEDLFAAPSVDPFSPDYEKYPDKAGVDAIAGVLHAMRPVAGVGVTIELAAHDVDDLPALQAPEAIKRYCRVKIGAS